MWVSCYLQAWLDRERLLLEELTATRLELRRAVAQQQAPGPTAAAAAAAASEASVAAEAPGLASYSDSNTFMAASSADTPAAGEWERVHQPKVCAIAWASLSTVKCIAQQGGGGGLGAGGGRGSLADRPGT